MALQSLVKGRRFAVSATWHTRGVLEAKHLCVLVGGVGLEVRSSFVLDSGPLPLTFALPTYIPMGLEYANQLAPGQPPHATMPVPDRSCLGWSWDRCLFEQTSALSSSGSALEPTFLSSNAHVMCS